MPTDYKPDYEKAWKKLGRWLRDDWTWDIVREMMRQILAQQRARRSKK